MQAIQDLQKGDVLLFLCTDRIARVADYIGYIRYQVSKKGATVQTIKDETSNPLLRSVNVGLAEQERAFIIERTRAALEVKRSRGQKLGGPTPYGKTRVVRDEVAYLEDNTEELATIEMIKDWHQNRRYSLRYIAKELARMGILSPKGTVFNSNAIEIVPWRTG